MSKENKSFEQALNELEEIVEKLENGDIPLEKAIEFYEKGMKLSKACDTILKDATEKVTLIMNEKGEKEAFELEEE